MKLKSISGMCLLASAPLVGWGTVSIADAQEAPAARAVAQLEEIVVTAQKRPDTAQTTPAAIAAVTGEQLAAQGISDLSMMAAIVPSAQFQVVRSQVQVFIRGVGQNNTGPNADPAIATNLNGIYQLSDMTGAAFFDLDRVEVLPGPQGTLYGRNAAGGTVNVISRRPGDTYDGNVSVEAGNYGELNTEAGVDLPLTDTFAVRAAAGVQRHDGYLSDGGDDNDTKAVRLTGLYKPTDAVSLLVITSATRNGGIGDQVVNKPAVDSNDPWYYPFNARGLGLYNQDAFNTLSAEFNDQFTDHLKFTYLSGFDEFNRQQFLILDGTVAPLAVQTQNIQQYGRFNSQEARLSGDYDRLKWLAGGYYYDSVQNYDNNVVLPPVTNVVQGPIAANGHGIAGFGQLTYSLLDWFRLTGGLRYSHDAKDGGGPYTVTVAGTAHPSPFTGSLESDHTDWKAGVEMDVAANSLLYANVQTGYNQGGFSFAPPIGGNPNTYRPEELRAYTLGSKNMFLDQRLQFNVEAYYYDYSNYQISARDLRTALNIIYNAQTAEVYGGQFDTRYLLTDHDKLALDLGLLHAVATKLVLPSTVSGQTDFSGYQLPYSPPVTLSGSYEHDWVLTNGAEISGIASSSYYGRRWGAYNHPEGSDLPSYHMTNLSLTYKAETGKWSVQAWVRNLENAAVWDSIVAASLPGPASGFLEPPRTYGVTLTAHF